MGLADHLTVPPPPAGVAKLDVLLSTLPKEDADALRCALEDPRFSAAHLMRVLRANGYQVGESSIKRWRAQHG